MAQHACRWFDPLMSDSEANEMLRLCERFGSYGLYSEENVESEIGKGLAQRHDAVLNFVRTGGRLGRPGSTRELAARTNYFRETYAYGEEIRAPGIERFLHHEGFVEAARELHGRPLVVPAIVYANLLVPGQELAVHTDVPEFRGVSRKTHPQWLCVVMHHSGLFDDWRMPIATGVSWFHRCLGGEFACYPDGPGAAAVAHPVAHNSAVLLDTDSVFHGVDPVGAPGIELAPLRPGMRLRFDGGDHWSVRDGERVVARYAWDDLRFSVSWKAYCFRDEAEQRSWARHMADLSLDVVMARLVEDLRRRGRIRGPVPGNPDLALLMIDEYIHFPPAAPEAASA
jgi:hypothetical protein